MKWMDIIIEQSESAWGSSKALKSYTFQLNSPERYTEENLVSCLNPSQREL